jgi:hypothetical protein
MAPSFHIASADSVEIGRTFDPQRRRVGAENQWQPVFSANGPTVE